jgi:dihydroorotate dehydrogenase electron transfer subunit
VSGSGAHVGPSPAPFGRRRARVLATRIVGAYRILSVEDPAAAWPSPGQFYMLATARRWGAGEAERPFLPRAFSHMRALSGAGPGATLEFMLEEVGPGTRRLAELRQGEDMWLTGPLGQGFKQPAPPAQPILVGGGVGLAPLVTLQEELGAAGIRAPLLAGFRDAAHAEGATLADAPLVATDDGSVGHHGPVTELLAAALERDANARVYACGPPRMLEAVRCLLAERGVPGQLALESGMACGYGACFGCVVATREGLRRVCVEGPVFDAAELEAVA